MTAIPVPSTGISVAVYIEIPEPLLNLPKRVQRKWPSTMRRIGIEGRSFWRSEAGRRLKSSRLAYQKALNFHIVDNNAAYITLSGFLAVSVENGRKGFDMKPGFLAKPGGKRKFPRALAASLPKRGAATRYRIIPLNVNRYINMKKPKVFRTVTDKSPAGSWWHPGFNGIRIVDTVIQELNDNIIPRNVEKLFREL